MLPLAFGPRQLGQWPGSAAVVSRVEISRAAKVPGPAEKRLEFTKCRMLRIKPDLLWL